MANLGQMDDPHELTDTELAGEYIRRHIKIFGTRPTSLDIVNRNATIISLLDFITLSEYRNDHSQNTETEDCW
jgi:hypothetical protein